MQTVAYSQRKTEGRQVNGVRIQFDTEDLLIETLQVEAAREWIVAALADSISGLHVDDLREATPETLTRFLTSPGNLA